MLTDLATTIKDLIIQPAWAAQNKVLLEGPKMGFRIPTLAEFISILVKMVLIIGGILVFGFMLFGGIQYISSGGDKLQAQQARDKITYAIIGLIIIVGAYAIAKVMEVAFGIDIFNITLPEPSNNFVTE